MVAVKLEPKLREVVDGVRGPEGVSETCGVNGRVGWVAVKLV